jgi:hypothetical protein
MSREPEAQVVQEQSTVQNGRVVTRHAWTLV